MRLLIVLFFFMAVGFLIGAVGVSLAPYYYYYGITNHAASFEWYGVNKSSLELVTPSESLDIKSENEINPRLWSKFHMKNQMISLPTKNPFYFIAPVFNYREKDNKTDLGLSILDASNKKIAQVYFLPKINFPKPSKSQKIFDFPIVDNELKKLNKEVIWKDLFQKDLSSWNIPYKEMIYNLYLLEVRAKLIAEKASDFYYLKNVEKGVISIESENKDFDTEVILSRRGNSIFSFILVTRKNNKEATDIRFKLINDTEFVDTTSSLSDIIYQEFRNLRYNQQIDHIGMVYLLSAWSHSESNIEILKLAVTFLERGDRNQKQLEPIYTYLYQVSGRTFAKKDIEFLVLSDEIELARKIDLQQAKQDFKIPTRIDFDETRTTVKEEYDQIIEETRDNIKKTKGIMRID